MKKPLQVATWMALFAGAILSSLALYQHWLLKYSGGVARGFCDAKGVVGCDSVIISPWAAPFFDLPIAAIALGLFFLTLVSDSIARFRDRTQPLYALMGMGSLFYLFQMFFIIGQLCSMCLAIHFCIWLSIGFKIYQSKSIFKFDWLIWNIGITVSLLFAILLQHALLPLIIHYKQWEGPLLSKANFILVSPPVVPNAPKVNLGSGEKKIEILVASDFMCLHCRDHFFELSRALSSANLSAEVTILINPLDDECNPLGGNVNPGACHAARVAICQNERNKFESFFRNVYLSPGRAMGGPETLIKMESSSSSERAELENCIQSKHTAEILNQHLEIVRERNLFGTPVTWTHGYTFSGRMGWKDWEEIFRRIKL